MVDVLGHLGMALVWLAPAWVLLERRKTAATLVAAGVWFGMLPDADLVLSKYVATVHHHGVLHTVLGVSVAAVVIGPLLGWVMAAALGGTDWLADRPGEQPYLTGVLLVWITGLSHLFADMLSAPDMAQPLEPLWPVFQGQLVFLDVVWFTSPLATWGLLLFGLAVNGVLLVWRGVGDERGEGEPAGRT